MWSTSLAVLRIWNVKFHEPVYGYGPPCTDGGQISSRGSLFESCTIGLSLSLILKYFFWVVWWIYNKLNWITASAWSNELIFHLEYMIFGSIVRDPEVSPDADLCTIGACLVGMHRIILLSWCGSASCMWAFVWFRFYLSFESRTCEKSKWKKGN